MAPSSSIAPGDSDGETKPALSGLDAPLLEGDDKMTPDGPLGRVLERLEDARDALMESPAFQKGAQYTEKALAAGDKVWTVARKIAWVAGTSALVLFVPLLYEIDKELGGSVAAGAPPDAAKPEAVGTAEAAATEAST